MNDSLAFGYIFIHDFYVKIVDIPGMHNVLKLLFEEILSFREEFILYFFDN